MSRIKDRMTATGRNKGHWFEQHLDEIMMKRINDGRARRAASGKKHFRPSEIHGCPRALWYSRKGYVKPLPRIDGARRMHMGTVIHEYVDSLLKDSDILESAEVLVGSDDWEIPILGAYDAVVFHVKTGEKLLAEFKSKSDSDYYKIMPHPDHVLQWNLYSYLTGIEEGFIWYMNKNDQKYETYDMVKDYNMLDDLLAKLRSVQEFVDADEHYPYQPNENHWFCDFRLQCESDYYVEGV